MILGKDGRRDTMNREARLMDLANKVKVKTTFEMVTIGDLAKLVGVSRFSAFLMVVYYRLIEGVEGSGLRIHRSCLYRFLREEAKIQWKRS